MPEFHDDISEWKRFLDDWRKNQSQSNDWSWAIHKCKLTTIFRQPRTDVIHGVIYLFSQNIEEQS